MFFNINIGIIVVRTRNKAFIGIAATGASGPVDTRRQRGGDGDRVTMSISAGVMGMTMVPMQKMQLVGVVRVRMKMVVVVVVLMIGMMVLTPFVCMKMFDCVYDLHFTDIETLNATGECHAIDIYVLAGLGFTFDMQL